MKFSICSVNASCSTTSSRNGRLKIVEMELRSAPLPVDVAGARTDHHHDEHRAERRDRGVGHRPGGEPLQDEHEQREHDQEVKQVRQRRTQRAEVLAQLVVTERRRQQQHRREQQRAKAQRMPLDAS